MHFSNITLEVVTPTREVLSRRVDSVTLTGELGEMQALPGHRTLLTSLRSGRLVYETEQHSESYHVSGGFAEILADRVVVLADDCRSLEETETVPNEAS